MEQGKLLFRNFFPVWPVSANHSWGRQGKKTFLSHETIAFRNEIEAELYVASYQNKFRGPYPGRVSLFLAFYGPDKRRRDIANLEKQICDAFTQSGVWIDDSQIDKLTLVRCESVGKDCGFYAEVRAL